MWVSLLFWLGLLVPGYAVVRLVAPEETKSGLLGVIGLAYFAVFAVLSPISILCYVARLPVSFFALACVLALLVGLFVITRKRWWGEVGRLLLAGASLELLILVADLVLGARVGAFLGGDARTHLARIRFLIDHGISNDDPYVSTRCFFALYHTNLLHVLNAAGAVLTRADVLDVWSASLVWAKLVAAAGTYYLTWCVFERPWVAWCAALFAAACRAPVTFLVYPNQVAPAWLLPMVLGFGVRAIAGSCSRWSAVKLAAGSFVLGQLHGLFAIFAGAALAAPLAVMCVLRRRRRQKDWVCTAACVAALGAGAPFVLISKYAVPAPEGPAPSSVPVVHEAGFRYWDNGWAMMEPATTVGGRGLLGPALLVAGIVGGLLSPRRRYVGALAAVAGSVAAILFVPPVCAAAIRLLGGAWVIARMDSVLYLVMITLVAGTTAALLEPVLRYRAAQVGLSLVAAALGGVYERNEPKFSWPAYYQNALAPAATRRARLNLFHDARTFLRQRLPPGVTVLTDEETAMYAVALGDCFVVAAVRGSSAVPDWDERKRDLATLLDPATPWVARRPLLHHYGIRLFLVSVGTLKSPRELDWTNGHVEQYWKSPDGAFVFLALNTE